MHTSSASSTVVAFGRLASGAFALAEGDALVTISEHSFLTAGCCKSSLSSRGLLERLSLRGGERVA